MTTSEILMRAKQAVADTARLDTKKKNEALSSMADSLIEHTDEILDANRKDIIASDGKISEVMKDRLMLDRERIQAMAKGIKDVALLPDPVGRVLSENKTENGLIIKKVSVAIGVVAIIYESRPNVTSDAAALALKSGNVCVLRSGNQAFRSCFAIVKALKYGLAKCSINTDMINIIEDTSRQSANELMTAVGFIDLLIPRGGAGLINACIKNATVPVIQTGTGICHIYVDRYADFKKALDIIDNAKTSRPSVCNAAEVCLVHKSIADDFLPLMKQRLCDTKREHPVELRLSERAAQVIDGTPAECGDFDTEFLDYILAVDVVDDIDSAIKHISNHSTHHSEAIITENESSAKLFTTLVDSAAVYVNASTRFTDGGQFGLGCEMGISTQKLHARGPMGLSELNTYKYVITGNGQIRG